MRPAGIYKTHDLMTYISQSANFRLWPIFHAGWLGWAMVPGIFQCQAVLLLLHIVGQGPAVLAAGAGQVGYIFYIFHLSFLSNVLSFGRRLNMTEILWFRLLNPKGSCQLLPRTSSFSTG